MLGLTLEDLDDGEVGVWPDNLAAMNVLIAMGTQWRTAGYGPTGLDYTALPAVMRLVGVARAEWPDTFECIRVLESEAMKIMSEQR
jgi:hypothetical protein